MTAHASETADTARLWAVRVQDPSFDDWDGFTLWLESDPAHLSAYEAALEAADWAEELFAAAPPPAPAEVVTLAPRPRRSWYVAGGAIAAAVAALGSWSVLNRDAPIQQIATAPGEHRTLALADGSRIVLNGGTELSYDPDTPRHIALAKGEALFEVRHDEANPFVVVAGGTRLVDAGTVFNVVHDGGALDVAVAEGAVIYQPGAREIRLNPGDGLSRADANAAPVLRKTEAKGVGGWQTGALQYSGATLDRVARDLSRNLGRPVRAAPGAAKLSFSGTLIVDGPPEDVLARAGPLLGVRFAREGGAWTMTPADGARR